MTNEELVRILLDGQIRLRQTMSELRTSLNRQWNEEMSYITEDFFLMANLFPKHTGLPFVVWISVRGGARHDARIKISPSAKTNPSEFITVAIRPTVHAIGGKISPHDLALIRRWVDLNYDVLMRYWDGDIDTEDAVALLKPIK